MNITFSVDEKVAAGLAPRIMGFGPAPVTRIGGRYALCTMCIGVGQGIALIVERV